MEFTTEISVMGRNVEQSTVDKIREPLARGIQALCNGDTVFITDVKHMTVAVTAQADGGKIHRLNVHDHGNSEGVYIGKDWITVNNFENYASYLSKLSPLFTKSAKIHLTHCYLGQNTNLMFMFAATFGAKVYAGTGQDAGAPYSANFGEYVGCTPAGTVFKEMRRP
jgi:hypothetical protein